MRALIAGGGWGNGRAWRRRQGRSGDSPRLRRSGAAAVEAGDPQSNRGDGGACWALQLLQRHGGGRCTGRLTRARAPPSRALSECAGLPRGGRGGWGSGAAAESVGER